MAARTEDGKTDPDPQAVKPKRGRLRKKTCSGSYQPREGKDREGRCPGAETFLAEEIRILRRMAHRLVEFAEGVESLDDAVTALNAFGCAAVRLSKLMKEQRELSSNSSEMEEAISIALREIRREFGLESSI
ncbi:MAG: hypothetical protein EHM41_19520 [Chloroflexi bacterium]|nr:MAG: hypothetical protein EHM41_19520 [Chloroflexota bacterium]